MSKSGKLNTPYFLVQKPDLIRKFLCSLELELFLPTLESPLSRGILDLSLDMVVSTQCTGRCSLRPRTFGRFRTVTD